MDGLICFFLSLTFLNKRYEIRLTPPPRLRKYFIKKRYFLNDGFPYIKGLLTEIPKPSKPFVDQAGIGTDFGSSVTVLRSSLHYEGDEVEAEQEKEVVTKEEVGEVEDRVDRFYNSIKSRMMVGEVISNIENNAHFTFDFLMLLVLAGVIAFLGLVESSSVTLVASMLISPMMGPILAGIFGTVIGDPKLRNLGIWNELMSLGICIIVGFVLGLIVCPWIEV